MKKLLRRVGVEALGWVLVVVGLAALVLPGPGLLALFAGVYLLATQYEWAERRLAPVQNAALRTAADSVATVPRIAVSVLGVAWLVAIGVYWGVSPAAPDWWPLRETWWLPGGWGTGLSLILSGILAGALVVYSYRNFRDIKAADPTPLTRWSNRAARPDVETPAGRATTTRWSSRAARPDVKPPAGRAGPQTNQVSTPLADARCSTNNHPPVEQGRQARRRDPRRSSRTPDAPGLDVTR